MSHEMFSLEQLDLAGFPGNLTPSKCLQVAGEGYAKKRTRTHSSGGENGGEVEEITLGYSGLSFVNQKDNKAGERISWSKDQHELQRRQFVDFGGFDNLYTDIFSPPFQSCHEEIRKLVESKLGKPEFAESFREKPYAASLEILKNYGSRLRRLNGDKISIPRFDIASTGTSMQKLSTLALLSLAGEKFIHTSNSTTRSVPFTFSHAYASSFLGLSEEQTKDLQVVQHLLAAAEKVGERQFHGAGKLLKKCKKLSFDKGNPVQRLVHYFSRALRDRIDRETGRSISQGTGWIVKKCVENTFATINSTVLAFEKAVPFADVSQFAGIQVIIEQVEGARKVHIIDLQIRLGTQYTMLLQALAARSECPVEQLKITAVATSCREAIEATGRRLASFAESFNLPFSFNIVMVDDILDLRESLFELDDEEAVAVYSEYFLMMMIGRPERLEHLMGVIVNLSPRVFVVTEVEANHNAPVFVDRFAEVLFYCGALFDCFEDCLKDNEAARMFLESIYFNQGIKNVVSAEGEERTIRHVKVKVWREFFARFGMVEADLSMSSMYQANLLLDNFACGNSCTFDMDGKSLIVGWKGTPFNSLSAWIFE